MYPVTVLWLFLFPCGCGLRFRHKVPTKMKTSLHGILYDLACMHTSLFLCGNTLLFPLLIVHMSPSLWCSECPLSKNTALFQFYRDTTTLTSMSIIVFLRGLGMKMTILGLPKFLKGKRVNDRAGKKQKAEVSFKNDFLNCMHFVIN